LNWLVINGSKWMKKLTLDS